MDSGVDMVWFTVFLDLLRIAIFDAIAISTRAIHELRAPTRLQQRRRDRPPLVSVLIPAYNEEENLETTVRSVLDSHYRNLEVIIIDDGSSDRTMEVARRLARDPRVQAVSQRRGGKSAALNMGLALARGEFLLQVDSDCYLHPDAIDRLLVRFQDPRVDAACGRVRVYLPERNLVTRLQAMEFIISFGAGRMASDILGITKVISGSFGMWRTRTLKDVGAWDHPMGEDGDMTIKVRKKRGRLVYAPHAVCENRVRDTWVGLTKQRYRWNRNYIKNRLRKHLDVADPFAYGWSNFWMFFDSILYRIVLFVLVMWGFAGMLSSDPAGIPLHLAAIALVYTLVTAVQYPLDVWLVSTTRREDMRLYAYMLWLHPYRIYLRFVQLASFVMELLFWDSYSSPYLPPEIQKRSVKW